MCFFGPDHRQLQMLSLTDLKVESYPPHTKLGTQPVHQKSLKGLSLYQGLSPFTYLNTYPSAFIFGFLHPRPWAKILFRYLCRALLVGGGVGH